MKALVPREPGTPKQRSIEVIHTYLQKGQGFSHAVRVKMSPKNRALRLIIVPPLILVGSLIFFLILLALGFTLMALYLFWALSRRKQQGSQEQL